MSEHRKDQLPVVYVQQQKRGRGRPRYHDPEQLREWFLTYIEETDIPIAAEFAYFMGMSRQNLYKIKELSDAIDLCNTKKQVMLERLALTGQVEKSMAIFSLKQLGWRDRPADDGLTEDRPPIIVSGGLPD